MKIIITESQYNRILIEELSESPIRISDEEIRRRISKFETLNDLIKYDKSAYYTATRKGKDFFYDVTKNLARQNKQKTDWKGMSNKDLLKIINKFSDTQALIKYEPLLYKFLMKKGKEYYDEMTKGLKRTNLRLTPDDIFKIASQYTSWKDFRRESPIAYAALKNRYYKMGDKELWNKVENILTKKEITPEYSDEQLIQIASQYPSIKSFEQSEPSVYISLNRKNQAGNLKLYNDATKHMQRSKPRVLKNNQVDSLKNVISQYDNLKDFVENEPNLFISMKRRGPVLFYDLTKDLEQNYDVKW